MPFDPSGNFTRVHNWQEDRDNGIRILADRHDEEDDNFADGFNQVFLRTGTVPMTGNLVMNGYKITSIGAGSETVPSLTWELSNNTGWWQPSPNALAVSTQGVKRLEVNNDSLSVYGGVNAKSFYVTDAPNPILNVADGNPLLGFSSGNFITFEVTTGLMKFVTNGTVKSQIDDYAMQSLVPHFFGDINHRLETPGGVPYHVVDTGDYWRFTRATDLFEWVIGENVKFSINPTSTVSHNWLTTAGITSTDAVIVPNGNAANPGLRFAADNDSGLFSHGDGSVAISTNAAERFRIDSTGVVSLINSPNFLISGTTYFNNPTVGDFYASTLSATNRILNFAANNYLGYDSASGVLTAWIGGTPRFTINGGTGNANFSNSVFAAGDFAGAGIYGNYVKSNGETHSLGLFYSNASGLSAGFRAVNSLIGHDFRLIAKDDGTFSLTNESAGISYISCQHTGDVTYHRTSHHAGVNHVNNTWHYNSRDFHWAGLSVDNSSLIIQGANGALTINDRGGGITWQEYTNFNSLTFWESSGGDAWMMQNDRYFRPAIDSAFAVGHPSFRMNAVYCVSSTMQTCDEREKDWIGGLSEKELAFGRDLMQEIGTFRWKAGLDDNMVQVGVRAQKMIALMERHGLDWNDYGFIRHDTWEESTRNGPVIDEDEDGNHIYEQIVEPAGDRYSVRLPELSLFMVAAQEQRLAALEGE